jgi:spermidine synthase
VPHGPTLLGDPRVEVVVGDVAAFLRESPQAAYDLVLLDVDNGPGYLVHDQNAGLYEPEALTSARRATRPGGQVVVWSGAEAPELFEAMRASFASAEEMSYAVDLGGRDESYWLYAGLVPDEHGHYEGTTDPS